MTGPAKALAFMSVAVIAFGGFFVLELSKAIIWLIFLIISYPVVIVFLSGAIEGTKFSPENLIAIYRESLKAIPSVLRFLKELFRSDKP